MIFQRKHKFCWNWLSYNNSSNCSLSLWKEIWCFSAYGDNSRTGLNCAGTEEELDESGDNGMDENYNESTSSSQNNYADNENGSETIQTKWLYIFKISDYMLPKWIVNNLNAAGALNKSDRRVLFARIFDECIKFT